MPGRSCRQRRVTPSNIAPSSGGVSVGRYSSTAVLPDAVGDIGGIGRKRRRVPPAGSECGLPQAKPRRRRRPCQASGRLECAKERRGCSSPSSADLRVSEPCIPPSAVPADLVIGRSGLRPKHLRVLGQAKEPRTRPVRPGDPLGDHGQRAVVLAFVFEPVFANQHGVGVPAPLTHQRRAGLQTDPEIAAWGAFLELCRQALQAAPQRSARLAIASLLQVMREGSDDQIASMNSERGARRRVGSSPSRTVASLRAGRRRLSQVQHNGDIGSPHRVGSTSASRSATNLGSPAFVGTGS
jgi:hypothetical protein